jgi:hypothetical protein
VVDVDIMGHFNNIPHDKLLKLEDRRAESFTTAREHIPELPRLDMGEAELTFETT